MGALYYWSPPHIYALRLTVFGCSFSMSGIVICKAEAALTQLLKWGNCKTSFVRSNGNYQYNKVTVCMVLKNLSTFEWNSECRGALPYGLHVVRPSCERWSQQASHPAGTSNVVRQVRRTEVCGSADPLFMSPTPERSKTQIHCHHVQLFYSIQRPLYRLVSVTLYQLHSFMCSLPWFWVANS